MKVQIFAALGTDYVLASPKRGLMPISRYRLRTCSAFFNRTTGTESVLLLRISILLAIYSSSGNHAGMIPLHCWLHWTRKPVASTARFKATYQMISVK